MEVHFAPLPKRDPLGKLFVEDQGSLTVAHLLVDQPGLRLLGPPTLEGRCGVFSVVTDVLSPARLAADLEREHGILTRPGLHCAPGAHRTMSTHDAGGATRLSLGPFLTEQDVDVASMALAEISREAAAGVVEVG